MWNVASFKSLVSCSRVPHMPVKLIESSTIRTAPKQKSEPEFQTKQDALHIREDIKFRMPSGHGYANMIKITSSITIMNWNKVSTALHCGHSLRRNIVAPIFCFVLLFQISLYLHIFVLNVIRAIIARTILVHALMWVCGRELVSHLKWSLEHTHFHVRPTYSTPASSIRLPQYVEKCRKKFNVRFLWLARITAVGSKQRLGMLSLSLSPIR